MAIRRIEIERFSVIPSKPFDVVAATLSFVHEAHARDRSDSIHRGERGPICLSPIRNQCRSATAGGMDL
jgi:hypothetical protein